MENHYNTPEETVLLNFESGEKKAFAPFWRTFLMGVLAGAFIAFGGATSSTAAHSVANVGLSRLVAAVLFPVGLMMIVLIGGELFTGNCLIVMKVFDKKVKISKFLLNLLIIFFGNFVGAFFIDVLIFGSGNLEYSHGLLGAYAIKVAVGKVAIGPIRAIISGILCNILVCAAILMAQAAKDIAGKIFAIFFPIAIFVVGGFEHCVANMYYIPIGMLASTKQEYVDMATETYGLTLDQIHSLTVVGFLHNVIPVAIGNLIGGSICIGGMCYLLYIKKKRN